MSKKIALRFERSHMDGLTDALPDAVNHNPLFMHVYSWQDYTTNNGCKCVWKVETWWEETFQLLKSLPWGRARDWSWSLSCWYLLDVLWTSPAAHKNTIHYSSPKRSECIISFAVLSSSTSSSTSVSLPSTSSTHNDLTLLGLPQCVTTVDEK